MMMMVMAIMLMMMVMAIMMMTMTMVNLQPVQLLVGFLQRLRQLLVLRLHGPHLSHEYD